LIHSNQDTRKWPFYVKSIKHQVCVSILLPDGSYAFDSSSLDPGAIKKDASIKTIASDRLDVKLSSSTEAEDDEVKINDLVETDVSLPVAAWIKVRLCLLGAAAHEEVVFRNDGSKSVSDRLFHSWNNFCKRGDIDPSLQEFTTREAIPVFASLISLKKRLEGEAAIIMGKKDSDWAAADDIMDRIDELGGVITACSLASVVGYSVEELRDVIDRAVNVMS
jgi:hypothetical protein